MLEDKTVQHKWAIDRVTFANKAVKFVLYENKADYQNNDRWVLVKESEDYDELKKFIESVTVVEVVRLNEFTDV